jgi:hypothetical protein
MDPCLIHSCHSYGNFEVKRVLVLTAHELSARYLMPVTALDQRKVLTVVVSPLSELVLITGRRWQHTSGSHVSYTLPASSERACKITR